MHFPDKNKLGYGGTVSGSSHYSLLNKMRLASNVDKINSEIIIASSI